MKIINVEQGSIEWHEARYRKIGGSASKGLFVKTDTQLIELIAEHLEDFEDVDNFQTFDMQRGTELEPYALEELKKYTGIEFKSAGWLQSEEVEILGISPDGISDDDRFSCEIKCPAKKKHTETILNDEIPLDNLHQCIHYFTVNPKLDKHYFCSFRPENNIKPLFVKELTRDSVVNLGTKAKPVLKTVQEWTEIAIQEAKKLEEQIKTEIEKLNF